MGALYALVLTITMTNGDYQDAVVGIFDNQQQCEAQRVSKWASLTAIQSKASFTLTKRQQDMTRNFEG